jgi:phosphohistidine phosphatase
MALTKRVTLLRHAKAQPGDPSMPDRDRPLSGQGRHDAPVMAHRLRATGARPSLILTSPAIRALDTARLVAQEIGYPLEFLQREADLYLATSEEILNVLQRQDDTFSDLVICGHNPGLTEFANYLTAGGIDNIPTCGIVIVDTTVRKWRQLRRGGTLVTFDYPKRSGKANSDRKS